jgi:hypothetical protein
LTSQSPTAPLAPGGATPNAARAVDPGRRTSLHWKVFWFGFVLFVVGRMAQGFAPALSRSEPTEIDDAYRYLAQAQVMAACFDGECPALQSIQARLDRVDGDRQVAFNQLRTDIHLYTYFHPLFSLALNGFRTLGLGASPAFTLVSALLGLMVVVAIGLWLAAVWGPAAAGIALMLLAFYPLPGQGMSFVPGTIALGWAALTWPVILRRKASLYPVLPLLWLASLATHPMGLFYVAAALLMLLGMSWPHLDRRELRLLAIGMLLIAGRLLLAALVPSFGLSGDVERFYPQPAKWTEALALGLTDLGDWVQRWGATYWRPVIAALLVVVGLVTTVPPVRRRVGVTSLALLAILVVSLLYYHPVHGSTAAGRIWGCVALFLVGAIANALVFGLNSAATWLAGARRGGARAPTLWMQGAALLLLGALSLRALATNLRYSLSAYPAAIARASAKDNLRLGGEATFAPILALRPDQAVVYLDEISLYSGLANGTYRQAAVYLPILPVGQGDRAQSIAEARPDYAIGLSPITRLLGLERGGIVLLPGEPLAVSGPGSPGLAWDAIRLKNKGGEAMLEIRSVEGSAPWREELSVPAGYAGWLPLPGGLSGRSEFSLTAGPDGGRLRVEGLRILGEAGTNWPWERGVRLRAIDPERPGQIVTVELTISGLAEAVGLPLEVVSDETSILVARIAR